MGWLRAMFSGHNPEATREIMRLAFRQNLKRANNRAPNIRRADAASHALWSRHRSRGFDKPLEIIAVEVLPFAFLADNECEAALAEYVVAGEHGQGADDNWLKATIRRGLKDFLHNPGEEYAPAKVRLFSLLTYQSEMLPWHILLGEEEFELIWDEAGTAMKQLGLDDSDVDGD